ncbi:DinB family protein [Croceivirga thetidis]|uniref:DinB family protein n=1 Tax=Croceivirga thetidis TaxID=2721623 RepID=A0ABX1GUU6_9FLAO|nr:DinB family protein [Croceivirga thetidis]NKI33409.1 DinB family protein [Croceivirga thetidis]
MTITDVIDGLSNNKKIFESLFELPHKDLILFKTDAKAWCFLEVVCHLIDEEVEDFRARISFSLASFEKPFKSISPKTWPIERKYLAQDFGIKVSEFIKERENSLNWLNSLEGVNWNKELLHPDLGKMSAKQFLHNWLAHDYLHIRQLNALKYKFLKEHSDEDLSYAGNW